MRSWLMAHNDLHTNKGKLMFKSGKIYPVEQDNDIDSLWVIKKDERGKENLLDGSYVKKNFVVLNESQLRTSISNRLNDLLIEIEATKSQYQQIMYNTVKNIQKEFIERESGGLTGENIKVLNAIYKEVNRADSKDVVMQSEANDLEEQYRRDLENNNIVAELERQRMEELVERIMADD